MVCYQNISDFFAYIQQNHLTSKPIEGYVPTEATARRMELENEASGYRGFLEVDEKEPLIYSRTIEELCGKRLERISLSFKDVECRTQKIILGANIIKESMAAMVQEMIDPASKDTHITIPYHVVSRLAAQYAPNISNDNKKLITLCFISLHTLSPGITLINYMSYANDNPTADLLSIFEYFLEESKVLKNNGQEMTIEQLGDDIAESIKNVLQNFIYGRESIYQLKYLSEIIDRVKISSGMIPLLRLLTENDIDVMLIEKAVEVCGTPVIWNDYGDLSIPNTVSDGTSTELPDFEVMALITSQALYRFLVIPDVYVCPMIPFCQSIRSSHIKNECYELPWHGKECLITSIAKSIGLE